jgi:hypothetical protein
LPDAIELLLSVIALLWLVLGAVWSPSDVGA